MMTDESEVNNNLIQYENLNIILINFAVAFWHKFNSVMVVNTVLKNNLVIDISTKILQRVENLEFINKILFGYMTICYQ